MHPENTKKLKIHQETYCWIVKKLEFNRKTKHISQIYNNKLTRLTNAI
jgi:hypothetical protein